MAKDQGVNLQAARGAPRTARAPAKPPASAPAAAAPVAPKKRTTAAQFYREVRVETRKITWPSWKETWVTSVMVFIMVCVAAVFLNITDAVLGLFIRQVLKLGG